MSSMSTAEMSLVAASPHTIHVRLGLPKAQMSGSAWFMTAAGTVTALVRSNLRAACNKPTSDDEKNTIGSTANDNTMLL